MSVDPAVAQALRLALALILAEAALHKLRDLDTFRANLAGYALLPRSSVYAIGSLVPFFELGLALALLATARPGPALASAALLGLYAFAIGLNLARGRTHIDCGCGGPGSRRPIDAGMVVRNGVLVLAALACALPLVARTLYWPDAISGLTAGLCLYLLFRASEVIQHNRSLVSQVWGLR